MNADDPDLQRPDEEAIKEITEKTRVALEKSVSQKVAAAMPVRAADKLAPAQYIRYESCLEVLASCWKWLELGVLVFFRYP